MANNIGGRWLDQDWRCPCGFRNAPIRAKCRNCRGPWKPEYRIAAEGSGAEFLPFQPGVQLLGVGDGAPNFVF